MKVKFKLLLTVALLLLLLGIATMFNVSVNFREYSLQSAQNKAMMAAAMVKDGLTAHMVNGIMDKREYFINQISQTHKDIRSLWLVRSPKVIQQYGKGYANEIPRDTLDTTVLKNGKVAQKVYETNDNALIMRITIPYIATVDGNPNCLSCHNVNRNDILGAISMEFDITPIRHNSLITIGKIFLINLFFIIIALLLINHFVTPYLKLFTNMQEGIKKAYKGNFEYKFSTSLSGDAQKTVQQLNTLFGKIQHTFSDIKYNLSTFVPKNQEHKYDPLLEANTIIKELSDIYKFKKTVELDSTKNIILSRIIDLLKEKYHLQNFELYEIEIQKGNKYILFKSGTIKNCQNNQEIANAQECRAFKTNTKVLSSDFINVCTACSNCSSEYLCLPFSINEDVALVLSINASNQEELSKLNKLIPNIKNYFEAAKPVIESRVLTTKLRDSSFKDTMTGLYNRRFLEEFIKKVTNQAHRNNDTYGVMMIDIDHFKEVNDTYGHDMGDKVIAKVGMILQENIRKADLAIRYGGEEFLVLLHNPTREGLQKVARKIHQEFAHFSFVIGNDKELHKTLSIGTSQFPEDAQSILQCIKYADIALYKAKTTGRNKIVSFTQDMLDDEKEN